MDAAPLYPLSSSVPITDCLLHRRATNGLLFPLRRRPCHHLPLPLLSFLAVNSVDVLAVCLPPLPHQQACCCLRSSLWFFPPLARHRCRPQDPVPPSQFSSLSLSSTIQPPPPLLSLLQQCPPRLLLFISSFTVTPPPHRRRSKSRLLFADLPSLQCGSTPTLSSSFSDLGAVLPHLLLSLRQARPPLFLLSAPPPLPLGHHSFLFLRLRRIGTTAVASLHSLTLFVDFVHQHHFRLVLQHRYCCFLSLRCCPSLLPATTTPSLIAHGKPSSVDRVGRLG